MPRAPALLIAALGLSLVACQSTPPHASMATSTTPIAAPAPAAAPVPAPVVAGSVPDDNLNAVAWQQTSTEYRLIALQTYRNATAQLDRALKDRAWDALTKEDRDRPAAGLPPAVIVDVDETVLDNSPYQARLIRDHQSDNEFSWAQWVKEEAATAIPGALEFTLAAKQRGIRVYFVSNRAVDLNDATFRNLVALGFPLDDREQFLGLGTLLDGCEQIGTEKGCRRRLVGRSHRVLVQVGDQIVDLVSVLANTPAGRDQAVAPYHAWIGERWFMLPNATYGSWEPALFNNEWSQPAAERRRQKIEAMRFK